MAVTAKEYQAYLVRIWSVKGNGGVVWRASVTNAHTNARQGFATLDELFAYLRAGASGDVRSTADSTVIVEEVARIHGGKMVTRQKSETLAIEEVLRRVEVAENRHDIDGMLAEMIDEPLLHLCGMPPVQGHEAIRQVYQGFFETFIGTTIVSQHIHLAAAGDMAWEQGSYVNEFQSPDGRVREAGKYLGIYHKIDGQWKAAAFCITPNGL